MSVSLGNVPKSALLHHLNLSRSMTLNLHLFEEDMEEGEVAAEEDTAEEISPPAFYEQGKASFHMLSTLSSLIGAARIASAYLSLQYSFCGDIDIYKKLVCPGSGSCHFCSQQESLCSC